MDTIPHPIGKMIHAVSWHMEYHSHIVQSRKVNAIRLFDGRLYYEAGPILIDAKEEGKKLFYHQDNAEHACRELNKKPGPRGPNEMEFSQLTEEAQNLIVDAVMGVYDTAPPEIPDHIRAEIKAWADQPPRNPDSPRSAWIKKHRVLTKRIGTRGQIGWIAVVASPGTERQHIDEILSKNRWDSKAFGDTEDGAIFLAADMLGIPTWEKPERQARPSRPER